MELWARLVWARPGKFAKMGHPGRQGYLLLRLWARQHEANECTTGEDHAGRIMADNADDVLHVCFETHAKCHACEFSVSIAFAAADNIKDVHGVRTTLL